MKDQTRGRLGKGDGGTKRPEGKVRGILRSRRPDGDVIEVSDGEEEPEEWETGDADVHQEQVGMKHEALRDILARTKKRILGGGTPQPGEREGQPGGKKRKGTAPVVEERGLVSGANLRPQVAAPFPLADQEASKGTGTPVWMERLKKKDDCSSQLLAQAVQSANRDRNRKKKDKKESPVQLLLGFLKGKKKKKRKKKEKPAETKPQGLKTEGGDPGDSSGGSSDSGSDSDEEEEKEQEEDSDADCELPLRRKANRRPGSVMELLIKNAQDQMDQSSLMDASQESHPMTQGLKIATYFALLIRPYHQGNSPLLREMYSLAQCMDLLRSGRLSQAADGLAARFIACHTAPSEGNWGTAAQLELFPMEAVQPAPTATMLQAQKHRRLLWKSQGYGPGWWPASGKGKGNYNQEKGKKGDKGKGKNKRGKGKESNWSQNSKGDANPWEKNKEEAAKK